MTGHGTRIGNWVYWKLITTGNFNSFTDLHTYRSQLIWSLNVSSPIIAWRFLWFGANALTGWYLARNWLMAEESESELELQLLYDWWFTVRQLVLAPSLLRLMTRLFLDRTLTAVVLTEHPLWRENAVYLLWICLVLVKSINHTLACYRKSFLLRNIRDLCQSKLCRANHVCLIHLMLQRQHSHLNGRKLHHHLTQLQEFYIFNSNRLVSLFYGLGTDPIENCFLRLLYKGVSIISWPGTAICTAAVARCNGRW